MPFYEIQNASVRQLKASRFNRERDLQRLCEGNLSQLFGVRFIATEFSTGGRQPGRIDTLGLDQDGSPTIIEYKLSQRDNVINQGLFYLDWLVDHKGDFVMAAQRQLGDHASHEINWDYPRLILVAEEFTDYDKYAVNRIGSNIELWTYRLYEDRFLFLETLYATRSQKRDVSIEESVEPTVAEQIEHQEQQTVYELEHHLRRRSEYTRELFFALRDGILRLGSIDAEIVETVNKLYISYRHGKNFVEVEVQAKGLKLYLDIPYSDLLDPRQLARDVSSVGHWGTGETEVKLHALEDLGYVLGLVEQAFIYTV